MIEKQVSRGIIRTYFEKLDRNLELDVAIVGGGPSGIVAVCVWHSSTANSLPAGACGAAR